MSEQGKGYLGESNTDGVHMICKRQLVPNPSQKRLTKYWGIHGVMEVAFTPSMTAITCS